MAARDALIYIPGLDFVPGQSLETITRHLACALERSAPTAAQVRVDPGSQTARFERLGSVRDFRYCRVFRLDAGVATRQLDVFELDYLSDFVQDFQDQHPLRVLVHVLGVTAANAGRVWRLLAGARTTQKRLQTVYALAIIFVIGLYLGLLGWAVVDGLRLLPEWLAIVPPAPGPLVAPWIVLLVAIAEQAWPGLTAHVRQGIQNSAVHFAALIDYCRGGAQRDAIRGKLLDLVEYLAEGASPSYDQVYLLTHSFGGIVALDLLFPGEGNPSPHTARVDGLATLGIPLDLCQLLWPEAFRHRHELAGHAPRWVNVYSPIDFLASDVGADATPAGPVHDAALLHQLGLTRVKPERCAYPQDRQGQQLALVDLLALAGFRAHVAYFQPVAQGQTNCFQAVVERLLRSTWLA